MCQVQEDDAALRARALFASDLETDSQPGTAGREDAIRQAIRVCGGDRGCLSAVAFAFGDHPDSALRRMRWARRLAYAGSVH